MRSKIAIVFLLAVAALLSAYAEVAVKAYEANWGSLDARPVPRWWVDAKFGIFVHWGVYSVPAYAPAGDASFAAAYAEWYHGKVLRGEERFSAYHAKRYANAPYANFAAEFKAENYNPKEWAGLFKKAGARYVVLTAKHHDGYALWPSPQTPYFNSVAMGPGRDLVGEFAAAMKEAGLRRGYYYSHFEYANPLCPSNRLKRTDVKPENMREWSRRINLPQMRDLVERYQADVLWVDGAWDYTSEDLRACEFLAWLYNESSVREKIVVNDRWERNRGVHGGHYTTEYGKKGVEPQTFHPWEECRGLGHSFGYNRFETPEHYMSREKCVLTLVDVVSRGGNLLLNVGPTSDGRIPAIMQDRLLAIGRWLEVNGEAIYGTTLWPLADETLRDRGVYFTQKGNALYLIITRWTRDEIVLSKIKSAVDLKFLGLNCQLKWKQSEDGLRLHLPDVSISELPCEAAWTIRIQMKSE